MSERTSLRMPQRLLEGTENGHRLTYGEHLDLHGPVPLPRHKAVNPWRTQLFAELERSGLTGRGGGGFSTAKKLSANSHSYLRPVLVINVMEGEPAARKDSVLACFTPHLILDGAEIIAALVHASSITIAVSRDNPAAYDSLLDAVEERRAYGNSPFSITVVSPPNRYIAGEESALAHWLDGGLSLPTFRPHKPAKLPVGSRGAVVENAETTADVALITHHGGEWFATGGVNGGSGTTLVTISGNVEASGVFEVPLGMPLGDVVALAQPVGAMRALLLGGYGGTFVGPQALSARYDPEGLKEIGGNIGAGVIIVFNSETCGLGETARIARWMANESAGQCGPCVFGLPALSSELEHLALGRQISNLRASLDRHIGFVDGRGACAHPDGVARLVRSALSVFAQDAELHLAGKPCSAVRKVSILDLPPNGEDLEWK